MLLVTILVSLLIVMIAFFAVVKSNVLAQKRELEKAKEDYTGFGGHYNDSYETGQFILKIKPWIFLGYAVLVIVIGLFTAVYSTTEKEIGFTSAEVDSYLQLLKQKHAEAALLQMLNRKREATLDDIHRRERQLEKLDYLRHQLRKRAQARQ